MMMTDYTVNYVIDFDRLETFVNTMLKNDVEKGYFYVKMWEEDDIRVDVEITPWEYSTKMWVEVTDQSGIKRTYIYDRFKKEFKLNCIQIEELDLIVNL